MPYDAYLCYSHRDLEVVREVADRLKGDGLDIWFDDDLESPRNVPLSLEAALADSRWVIVFVSRHALDSQWVEFEIKTAKHRHPKCAGRGILAVRLDDAEWRGFLLEDPIRVDWRKPSEKKYLKILNTCNSPDSLYQKLSVNINDSLVFQGPTSFKSSIKEIRAGLTEARRVALLTRTGVNWWRDFGPQFCHDLPGKELRILVVDPGNKVAMRHLVRTDRLERDNPRWNEKQAVAERRRQMASFLGRLRLQHPDIKLKTLGHVPSWTMLLVEPPEGPDKALMYVELTTCRSGGRGRPVFKLGRQAGGLFDVLKTQFEQLWNEPEGDSADTRRVAHAGGD